MVQASAWRFKPSSQTSQGAETGHCAEVQTLFPFNPEAATVKARRFKPSAPDSESTDDNNSMEVQPLYFRRKVESANALHGGSNPLPGHRAQYQVGTWRFKPSSRKRAP